MAKIKHHFFVKSLAGLWAALWIFLAATVALPANAQTGPDQKGRQLAASTTPANDKCIKDPSQLGCPDYVGKTSIIGGECNDKSQTGATACLKNCKAVPFICNVIQPVVNVLSALVAVVVVGSIVLGGVQYAMAGDKPETITAARKRITNGLTALLIFFLLFAFIQYLIPGGIFQ